MNVTDIVDHESEGIRFTLVFREACKLLLHCCIDEGALIIATLHEPVHNVWDGLVNRVGVHHKPWVIVNGATLVEVRGVNEVPSGLPRAALSLDFVGEGSALNEWIVALIVGHLRMSVLVGLKHGVSLGQSSFALGG